MGPAYDGGSSFYFFFFFVCFFVFFFGFVFFFQAEDGIRDIGVTGVQTCALPISDVPTGCLTSLHCSSFPLIFSSF